MENELIIDEHNFNEYFFDVKKHTPGPGEILVCYEAMADLVSGQEKRYFIELLQKDSVIAASQFMKKVFKSTEADSVRVCKEVIEDLLAGKKFKKILNKKYRYKMEMFFYTRPEYVPKNDPHWKSISLINLNKIAENQGAEMVEGG